MSLLAACGYFGGSHSGPAAHPAPKAHAASTASPADPAAQVLSGMVAAVESSRGQPPVELRFAIRSRPEVGQPDEIDYALIPQVPGLGAVRLVFGPFKDLKLVGQASPLLAVKPAVGVPILGSVTFQPLKTGFFTLTATVAVAPSTAQSVMWPFSIPVIVGEGLAEAAAK